MSANTPEQLSFAARHLGKRLSELLPEGVTLAAYGDPKNGRVCINFYPDAHDDAGDVQKRLAAQRKTNKALIFRAGQLVTEGE